MKGPGQSGSPNGIRTRVATLRGAPRTSLRPATIRESADRQPFSPLSVSGHFASFVSRWGTEGARPGGLRHLAFVLPPPRVSPNEHSTETYSYRTSVSSPRPDGQRLAARS